jgi:hypothetical protein
LRIILDLAYDQKIIVHKNLKGKGIYCRARHEKKLFILIGVIIKLFLSSRTFKQYIGGKVVFHHDIIVYNNLYRDKFVILFLVYLFSLYREGLKT